MDTFALFLTHFITIALLNAHYSIISRFFVRAVIILQLIQCWMSLKKKIFAIFKIFFFVIIPWKVELNLFLSIFIRLMRIAFTLTEIMAS